MNKKRVTVLLLALYMALSLCACGEEEAPAVPAGVAVQVQSVSVSDISTEHRVTGTVSGAEVASFYLESGAKCTASYVSAGQQVREGDKLCRIQNGALLASFNAADATYLSTLENYYEQKSILGKQIALYQDQWNNAKALYEVGAASRLEVEQAELQYLTAITQRDSALAQMESGLENYKLYQEESSALAQDESGVVYAPFDGSVSLWKIGSGTKGTGDYPLAVISGDGTRKVTAMVSEVLVPLLHEGDRVRVQLSAINAEFDGTIRSLSESANQQTRLYTVSIDIPQDTEGLASGMFADITFYTDTSLGAVVVPTGAILTSNGTQYVFTVEDDTAKYVEIETGLVGDGVTEIVSGLSGGEQLVTVGQQYLTDGETVRIVSAED